MRAKGITLVEILIVVDSEARKRIEHMQHLRGSVGSPDSRKRIV